jgi:hypothetical protein
MNRSSELAYSLFGIKKFYSNDFINFFYARNIEGKNGKGQTGYTGSCPPSGTHRYFFKVYAFDARLDLEKGADKKEVENAMQGHVLATGELIGLFSKAVEGRNEIAINVIHVIAGLNAVILVQKIY